MSAPLSLLRRSDLETKPAPLSRALDTLTLPSSLIALGIAAVLRIAADISIANVRPTHILCGLSVLRHALPWHHSVPRPRHTAPSHSLVLAGLHDPSRTLIDVHHHTYDIVEVREVFLIVF